jgi:ubiquinone/menaquinone biosynthesis C-methylase UbiE
MAAAHRRLVDEADLRPDERVLEIGCGTGNLALLVKRLRPGLDVVVLDPDPKALARARRKATRRGLAVQLDRGFAEELPYPDATFDRVLSAFMFHHLERADRPQALREVSRTLRRGGSPAPARLRGDQGPRGRIRRPPLAPQQAPSRHFGDCIPTLMREAGLADPIETGHRVTRLGRYTLWSATQPTL